MVMSLVWIELHQIFSPSIVDILNLSNYGTKVMSFFSELFQQQNWYQRRYWIGSIVVFVASLLSFLGYTQSNSRQLSAKAIDALLKLENKQQISVEEKNLVRSFLMDNEIELQELVKYFLDDANLVEKVSKKNVSPFTQVSKLLHQKKHQQALDLAKEIQNDLSCVELKTLNLMRIIALQKHLNLPYQDSKIAFESIRSENPEKVEKILSFYRLENISFEDVFLVD
jgi:hypothetical protein